MKILQVLLSPRIGGAEALADSLDTEWSSNGLTCKTHYLDADNRQRHSRLGRIVSLSRSINEFRPDIVVSHSALPNLYARLVTPWGIPVVAVLHSATDDFAGGPIRWAEHLLRRRTAAIVGVSLGQVDQYVAHFGSRIPTPLIPNGIRRDALPKKGFQNIPTTAVTVARVAPQKNPHLWVEAVQLLAAEKPGLTLEWWGPLSMDGSLHDVFSQAALEGTQGAYLGATSDPVAVLKASDFLFHTADREAHSIGILEAAAVGLPVVCSETVAATLPSTVVAVPFTDGSAESAVEAIKSVYDGWPKWADNSLGGAPGVIEEFSISRCALKYVELFHEILRSPRYDKG